jgi:hypothetical protein
MACYERHAPREESSARWQLPGSPMSPVRHFPARHMALLLLLPMPMTYAWCGFDQEPPKSLSVKFAILRTLS